MHGTSEQEQIITPPNTRGVLPHLIIVGLFGVYLAVHIILDSIKLGIGTLLNQAFSILIILLIFQFIRNKPKSLIYLPITCCIFFIYALFGFSIFGDQWRNPLAYVLLSAIFYTSFLDLIPSLRRRAGLSKLRLASVIGKIATLVIPLFILVAAMGYFMYSNVPHSAAMSRAEPFKDIDRYIQDHEPDKYVFLDEPGIYLPEDADIFKAMDETTVWKNEINETFMVSSDPFYDKLIVYFWMMDFESGYDIERTIQDAGYFQSIFLIFKAIVFREDANHYYLESSGCKATLNISEISLDSYLVEGHIYIGKDKFISFVSKSKIKSNALMPILLTIDHYRHQGTLR